MKIVKVDKLKHHFENVVDVKLFTPAQICTIIDTFTEEIPLTEIDTRRDPSEAQPL